MSEQLFIRLGSQEQDKIHWLVWSNAENEIIASGELPEATQLNSLKERAGGRAAIVLVPSNDVLLKQVETPARANRQFISALPYMLEEELAADVDTLFFATGDKVERDGQHYLNVAIVDSEKMQSWLDWLQQAEIPCQQLMPDVLALPQHEEAVALMQLGNDWIVRNDQFSGFNVPDSQLAEWLSMINQTVEREEEESEETQTEQQPIVLANYTPMPAGFSVNEFEFAQQELELPLQTLAQGAKNCAFNLRQGPFQRKKDSSKFVKIWRNALILVGVTLTLHLATKGIAIYQLNEQADLLKGQVEKAYMASFPGTRKVNVGMIRRNIKNKLKELGGGAASSSFLAMVDSLQPAFSQVTDMKPENIRFDAKRGELRIRASANNFQSFEKFKSVAQQSGLQVDQGSLTNNEGKVSGALTIRSQS